MDTPLRVAGGPEYTTKASHKVSGAFGKGPGGPSKRDYAPSIALRRLSADSPSAPG